MAEDLSESSDQVEATQLEFVLTELEVVISFCRVAASTDDPAKRKRNIENARNGYESALRFSRESRIGLENHPEFRQKMESLKEWLERLMLPTD